MVIRVAAIEVSHWHSVYDAEYLLHLAKMSDVQIVGIQDPDKEVAASRATMIGDPPTYTDYELLLSETQPDFVLALGRHSVMAEIAHHLLDRGYPFIMEKPMGFNASQVRSVAEKTDALRGFAAVPLGNRYLPFAKLARKMVLEGEFDQLSHMYFRLNRPTSDRYVSYGSSWMLDPSISNGGCLRNLGAHGLDMFLYLSGEDASVVGAQLSWTVHGRRVEDYASVLLKSRSGVLCTVEVGNTYPGDGTDAEWKIAGRDAMLISKENVLRTIAAGREEIASSLPEAPASSLVLRDTLDRWHSGQPPPVSIHDCYRAVQLIDQAYEAAGNPYTH